MIKTIIISAPSGSGKSTIVKYLLSNNDNFQFSISATTRKLRGNEIDGKDYYFISNDEFQNKIKNNDFIEYQEVYPGHFYGTLFSEVERIWNNNKIVLFDTDVSGGINLKSKLDDDAISIFIKPPSIEELKKRLIARNTDTSEQIEMRIAKATKEMEYSVFFDHIVLNNNLEDTKKEIENLLSCYSLKI
jgi:guanylate kinase